MSCATQVSFVFDSHSSISSFVAVASRQSSVVNHKQANFLEFEKNTMDLIQPNDKVLLLWDSTFDPSTINTDELKSTKNVAINFENVERLTLGE